MTPFIETSLREVMDEAHRSGRKVLLEPEGLQLAAALGFQVPVSLWLRHPGEEIVAALDDLPGDRVVLKVISPRILHKSDQGGVVVVAKERRAIARALDDMWRRFEGADLRGCLLMEYVEHDKALGGELLLGARWTEDFGPVVTFGAGGVATEYLASQMRPGRDVAIVSPDLRGTGAIDAALDGAAVTPLVLGDVRKAPARIDRSSLRSLVDRLLEFAAERMPHDLTDFEINPFVMTGRGPVALDVLAKLGDGRPRTLSERPLDKMPRLLRPESIAVMGVSSRMNPGRIILRNILRSGFPPARLTVIKPGYDRLDGCRCVPDLAHLPGKVDLLVLSIDAAQVPAVVDEVLARQSAESLTVVPGGLGERPGSEPLADRLRRALADSRLSAWRGPLINGGNCLGIRSRPGQYDTMFIPTAKLPPPTGPETPLAVISQSGAFAVARTSRWEGLNPRYLVSIGNQVDLTVGDYLESLADDPAVRVYACYVEGFQPGDGLRFVQAARRIVTSGRTVILYRAGRTEAGVKATASHTASLAGDFAVTRALARAAGAIVAESLEEFDDLVPLFCRLQERPARGARVGAISNAGFECVAMADNLNGLRMPTLTEATRGLLNDIYRKAHLDTIVTATNPCDLTPILGDELYVEAVKAVLEDDNVDVGVVGIVPLSGAIQTLPAEAHHKEDMAADDALAARLHRLWQQSRKPWVAVVDAGPLYEPFVAKLEEGGIPVFRRADAAMRLLARYCAATNQPTA